MSTPPKPTLQVPDVECRLRIIAINDVYILQNYPRLHNLIVEQSAGQQNVVTTLVRQTLTSSCLDLTPSITIRRLVTSWHRRC
jgi:hypothetical protein